MVEYLTQHLIPKKVSKTCRKVIEIEVKDYKIIADQHYKKGKENQLRLCITKVEYVKVLEQAHSGLSGGHFQ